MRIFQTALLILVVGVVASLFFYRRTPEINPAPASAVSGAAGSEDGEGQPQDRIDDLAAGAKSAADVCSECGQVHAGFVCAMYGGGKIMTLDDLPAGKVRSTVEKLSVEAQRRALLQLSRMNFRASNEVAVRVDAEGSVYYVCTFTNAGLPEFEPSSITENALEAGPAAASASQYAPVPVATPPVYHSKPGATNILFLDFNGAEISNTYWNASYGVNVWCCLPFDTDGDISTFADAEQRYIREIWERVAEDYAVFNVDVTTEQPLQWTRNTAHALITPTKDGNGVNCPHYGYGGIAYLNVFGANRYSYNESNCYSPAWVTPMPSYSYSATAEAAAHELGHNLGLSHDGTIISGVTNEYYYGHVNGSISWGPIMGAAYGKNVSQWSRGEYYGASQLQDDLSIMDSKLKFRPDDCGNTIAQASGVLTSGGVFSATGAVERTGDSDLFSFTCIGGTLVLTGATYHCSEGTWGGNGDLVLTLYNASGALLASNNPELDTKAVITQAVTGGTYYLKVSPAGAGNPMDTPPSGYTSYGSIGPYSISGSAPLPDRDGDGIPDNWELQYYGGETNANPNAKASNGINSVMDAYIAGLNPTSPTSFFKVSASGLPAVSSGGFVVRWDAVTGRVYSVQRATNLLSSFQPVQTNIFWPQASYTDTVNAAESRRFYKVNVQLAP